MMSVHDVPGGNVQPAPKAQRCPKLVGNDAKKIVLHFVRLFQLDHLFFDLLIEPCLMNCYSCLSRKRGEKFNLIIKDEQGLALIADPSAKG